MTYRKATLADGGDIYRLICDMEDTMLPRERFDEIYEKQLRNDSFYCLLGEENGKTVAMLNLRFEEQLHHADRVAEIMEFVVDREYRNGGVGKGMLAQACKIARAQGCVQIEVACNQLRKDTHRFYQREGMQNFHFKFSKPLNGPAGSENRLGR